MYDFPFQILVHLGRGAGHGRVVWGEQNQVKSSDTNPVSLGRCSTANPPFPTKEQGRGQGARDKLSLGKKTKQYVYVVTLCGARGAHGSLAAHKLGFRHLEVSCLQCHWIAMGQNKQQRDGTAVASLFYDVVKTQSDCMFILKLPKNLSACCIPIWPLLLSPAGTAQPKVLS